MGVVYKGWDTALKRHVAIKMIHRQCLLVAGSQAYTRFGREGQALAKLEHTNIVAVYESGVHEGSPFLVMEYVAGGSLAAKCKEFTNAGPKAISRLMVTVARAVQVAHDHQVLHCDLKPANILFDENEEPHVADLGLAVFMTTEDTELPYSANDQKGTGQASSLTTGHGRGTPEYMAPEQFDKAYGPITQATDIWALGVILYELLMGHRPFEGPRTQMGELVCGGQFSAANTSHLNAAGHRLLAVALRCLAKDPKQRFASAEHLAQALERATAPRRWKLVLACLLLSLGIFLVIAHQLKTWPFRPATWPDLPAITEARTKLARGEPVVLIDKGKPPVAVSWPCGPESGKVTPRDDGLFSFRNASSGVCMLELLPDLPEGRYRIDAELRHETATGVISWVGVYGAASHFQIPRGRQHYFLLIRYADVGEETADPPESKTIISSRRPHLGAMY
jgi:serine/threonine protein kinase